MGRGKIHFNKSIALQASVERQAGKLTPRDIEGYNNYEEIWHGTNIGNLVAFSLLWQATVSEGKISSIAITVCEQYSCFSFCIMV